MSKNNDDDGGVIRPSTPLQYLLPAARVGLYVYRALAAAEDFELSTGRDDSDGKRITATREALDGILLNPPHSCDPRILPYRGGIPTSYRPYWANWSSRGRRWRSGG